MKINTISYERIRELFTYRDGCLYWRVDRNKYKRGDKAAHQYKSSRRYLYVYIEGRVYGEHRLMWLYHHGYFPENEIDHIDRDPANNRIENLREVSHMCNLRNTGNRIDSPSGVKGVTWDCANNKWQVKIKVMGDKRSLGYYNEFHNAVLARLAGEQCLDWFECDSNSPARIYADKYIFNGSCGRGGTFQ